MQTRIQDQGRRVVFTRRHARRYHVAAALRRAKAARASVGGAFRAMARALDVGRWVAQLG